MGLTKPLVYFLSKMKFFNYNLTLDIDGVRLIDKNREKPIVIDCLNPHSFITANDDPEFKQALEECDILLPDGVGICMEIHRYRNKQIKKIAGDDLHMHLLDELNAIGGKAFYMGSRLDVLQKIKDRITLDYPNIKVMVHSPSYAPKFSDEENAEIVSKIEAFAPDVLLVGLTAPKQEKWIHSQLGRLTTPKVICAIGGAFEFFAGTIKRAPQWAINIHCEWLWRFMREPRRMWQRNMVSTPRFLRYVKQHHEEM